MIEDIYNEVSTLWETDGLEALSKAVAIDSLSPAFRPNWNETGELYEILNYYIDHAERTLGGQTTLTPKIYDNGNTNSNKPIPPFLRITIPGNDQCNFSTVTAPQRPRSVTEISKCA